MKNEAMETSDPAVNFLRFDVGKNVRSVSELDGGRRPECRFRRWRHRRWRRHRRWTALRLTNQIESAKRTSQAHLGRRRNKH